MKRIVLFLVTNFAVLLVLSVVASVLGVDRFLTEQGLDLSSLLVFSAIIGFGGSIISLLISQPMAKMGTGAQVIDGSEGTTQYWLVQTVRKLADKAGIGMPEVAVFEGAPNAFATGAFKNSALVAVSTGLLQAMSRDEVEAVLGHEVAHVANGDMVTLALIQGVVNTFVVFFARIVGYVVDGALSSRDGERQDGATGPAYYVTVFACEIAFGLLASMIVAWFSRQREFRADAGSARLLGTPAPMMAALARLGGLSPGALPQSLRTFGITDAPAWLGLFASHPPVEARIAALHHSRPAAAATSR